MRTFKDLQDSVLSWMADENDTGLMRQLVQNHINHYHQQLLKEERYDFMLWPQAETLTVVTSQTVYALHPRFEQPLYFYNPTTSEYLEEVPAKSLLEAGINLAQPNMETPNRFMLTGISKLKRQPSEASVITVTTTGGSEAAANSILITGVDSTGEYVTETLSSENPWTTLTSSTSFVVIEDITKVGASWSRTITVTDADTNTLLVLLATEYGRQYRMLEFLGTPSAAASLSYRFYRKPRQLVYDNDIPDLPEGYDDMLVLKGLIAMQGYSRATPEELREWTSRLRTLEQNLKMTYQQSRSLGGRPTFTRYIPRG